MKLSLINDLPLFSTPDDADGFEEAARTQIEAVCPQFPATTTYVGFEELVRTWTWETCNAPRCTTRCGRCAGLPHVPVVPPSAAPH